MTYIIDAYKSRRNKYELENTLDDIMVYHGHWTIYTLDAVATTLDSKLLLPNGDSAGL